MSDFLNSDVFSQLVNSPGAAAAGAGSLGLAVGAMANFASSNNSTKPNNGLETLNAIQNFQAQANNPVNSTATATVNYTNELKALNRSLETIASRIETTNTLLQKIIDIQIGKEPIDYQKTIRRNNRLSLLMSKTAIGRLTLTVMARAAGATGVQYENVTKNAINTGVTSHKELILNQLISKLPGFGKFFSSIEIISQRVLNTKSPFTQETNLSITNVIPERLTIIGEILEDNNNVLNTINNQLFLINKFTIEYYKDSLNQYKIQSNYFKKSIEYDLVKIQYLDIFKNALENQIFSYFKDARLFMDYIDGFNNNRIIPFMNEFSIYSQTTLHYYDYIENFNINVIQDYVQKSFNHYKLFEDYYDYYRRYTNEKITPFFLNTFEHFSRTEKFQDDLLIEQRWANQRLNIIAAAVSKGMTPDELKNEKVRVNTELERTKQELKSQSNFDINAKNSEVNATKDATKNIYKLFDALSQNTNSDKPEWAKYSGIGQKTSTGNPSDIVNSSTNRNTASNNTYGYYKNANKQDMLQNNNSQIIQQSIKDLKEGIISDTRNAIKEEIDKEYEFSNNVQTLADAIQEQKENQQKGFSELSEAMNKNSTNEQAIAIKGNAALYKHFREVYAIEKRKDARLEGLRKTAIDQLKNMINLKSIMSSFIAKLPVWGTSIINSAIKIMMSVGLARIIFKTVTDLIYGQNNMPKTGVMGFLGQFMTNTGALAALQTIKDTLSSFISKIWNSSIVQTIFQSLKKNTWDVISESVSSMWETIKEYIYELMGVIFQTSVIISGVRTIFNDYIKTGIFQQKIKSMLTWMYFGSGNENSKWSGIFGLWGGMFRWVYKVSNNYIESVKSNILSNKTNFEKLLGGSNVDHVIKQLTGTMIKSGISNVKQFNQYLQNNQNILSRNIVAMALRGKIDDRLNALNLTRDNVIQMYNNQLTLYQRSAAKINRLNMLVNNPNIQTSLLRAGQATFSTIGSIIADTVTTSITKTPYIMATGISWFGKIFNTVGIALYKGFRWIAGSFIGKAIKGILNNLNDVIFVIQIASVAIKAIKSWFNNWEQETYKGKSKYNTSIIDKIEKFAYEEILPKLWNLIKKAFAFTLGAPVLLGILISKATVYIIKKIPTLLGNIWNFILGIFNPVNWVKAGVTIIGTIKDFFLEHLGFKKKDTETTEETSTEAVDANTKAVNNQTQETRTLADLVRDGFENLSIAISNGFEYVKKIFNIFKPKVIGSAIGGIWDSMLSIGEFFGLDSAKQARIQNREHAISQLSAIQDFVLQKYSEEFNEKDFWINGGKKTGLMINPDKAARFEEILKDAFKDNLIQINHKDGQKAVNPMAFYGTLESFLKTDYNKTLDKQAESIKNGIDNSNFRKEFNNLKDYIKDNMVERTKKIIETETNERTELLSLSSKENLTQDEYNRLIELQKKYMSYIDNLHGLSHMTTTDRYISTWFSNLIRKNIDIETFNQSLYNQNMDFIKRWKEKNSMYSDLTPEEITARWNIRDKSILDQYIASDNSRTTNTSNIIKGVTGEKYDSIVDDDLKSAVYEIRKQLFLSEKKGITNNESFSNSLKTLFSNLRITDQYGNALMIDKGNVEFTDLVNNFSKIVLSNIKNGKPENYKSILNDSIKNFNTILSNTYSQFKISMEDAFAFDGNKNVDDNWGNYLLGAYTGNDSKTILKNYITDLKLNSAFKDFQNFIDPDVLYTSMISTLMNNILSNKKYKVIKAAIFNTNGKNDIVNKFKDQLTLAASISGSELGQLFRAAYNTQQLIKNNEGASEDDYRSNLLQITDYINKNYKIDKDNQDNPTSFYNILDQHLKLNDLIESGDVDAVRVNDPLNFGLINNNAYTSIQAQPTIIGNNDYRFAVNKRDHILSVLRNKDLIKKYNVTTGKTSGPRRNSNDGTTPEGKFKITQIQDSSKWTYDYHDGKGKVKAYGPWFLRLNDGPKLSNGKKLWSGIGIHGTARPEKIGADDSEGCIRLLNKDITELKEKYAKVGTQVDIYDGIAPIQDVIDISNVNSIDITGPKDWTKYILKYSSIYGIDPELISAMIKNESNGDPRAVSYAGAKGLMQIMPKTGKEIAGKLKVSNYDLFDPETSIRFGTYYIAEKIKNVRKKYPNATIIDALRAYNGGEGTLARYINMNPYEIKKHNKQLGEYPGRVLQHYGSHNYVPSTTKLIPNLLNLRLEAMRQAGMRVTDSSLVPTVSSNYNPSDYQLGITDYMRFGNKTAKDNYGLMNPILRDRLAKYAEAFYQKYKKPIVITSTYRSYEHQKRLWDNRHKNPYPVARPSPFNRHTLGAAVDLSVKSKSIDDNLLAKFRLKRPSPKGDAVHVEGEEWSFDKKPQPDLVLNQIGNFPKSIKAGANAEELTRQLFTSTYGSSNENPDYITTNNNDITTSPGLKVFTIGDMLGKLFGFNPNEILNKFESSLNPMITSISGSSIVRDISDRLIGDQTEQSDGGRLASIGKYNYYDTSRYFNPNLGYLEVGDPNQSTDEIINETLQLIKAKNNGYMMYEKSGAKVFIKNNKDKWIEFLKNNNYTPRSKPIKDLISEFNKTLEESQPKPNPESYSGGQHMSYIIDPTITPEPSEAFSQAIKAQREADEKRKKEIKVIEEFLQSHQKEVNEYIAYISDPRKGGSTLDIPSDRKKLYEGVQAYIAGFRKENKPTTLSILERSRIDSGSTWSKANKQLFIKDHLKDWNKFLEEKKYTIESKPFEELVKEFSEWLKISRKQYEELQHIGENTLKTATSTTATKKAIEQAKKDQPKPGGNGYVSTADLNRDTNGSGNKPPSTPATTREIAKPPAGYATWGDYILGKKKSSTTMLIETSLANDPTLMRSARFRRIKQEADLGLGISRSNLNWLRSGAIDRNSTEYGVLLASERSNIYHNHNARGAKLNGGKFYLQNKLDPIQQIMAGKVLPVGGSRQLGQFIKINSAYTSGNQIFDGRRTTLGGIGDIEIAGININRIFGNDYRHGLHGGEYDQTGRTINASWHRGDINPYGDNPTARRIQHGYIPDTRNTRFANNLLDQNNNDFNDPAWQAAFKYYQVRHPNDLQRGTTDIKRQLETGSTTNNPPSKPSTVTVNDWTKEKGADVLQRYIKSHSKQWQEFLNKNPDIKDKSLSEIMYEFRKFNSTYDESVYKRENITPVKPLTTEKAVVITNNPPSKPSTGSTITSTLRTTEDITGSDFSLTRHTRPIDNGAGLISDHSLTEQLVAEKFMPAGNTRQWGPITFRSPWESGSDYIDHMSRGIPTGIKFTIGGTPIKIPITTIHNPNTDRSTRDAIDRQNDTNLLNIKPSKQSVESNLNSKQAIITARDSQFTPSPYTVKDSIRSKNPILYEGMELGGNDQAMYKFIKRKLDKGQPLSEREEKWFTRFKERIENRKKFNLTSYRQRPTPTKTPQEVIRDRVEAERNVTPSSNRTPITLPTTNPQVSTNPSAGNGNSSPFAALGIFKDIMTQFDKKLGLGTTDGIPTGNGGLDDIVRNFPNPVDTNVSMERLSGIATAQANKVAQEASTQLTSEYRELQARWGVFIEHQTQLIDKLDTLTEAMKRHSQTINVTTVSDDHSIRSASTNVDSSSTTSSVGGNNSGNLGTFDFGASALTLVQ